MSDGPEPTQRLGFKIGVSKRKKLSEIIDDSKPQIPLKKHFDSTEQPEHENKTLIIHLPPPINSSSSISHSSSKNLSIDERAALEIIKESQGSSATTELSNELTIQVVGVKQEKSGKPLPMLIANLPPELLSMKREEDRLKKDISLRAEDMDVTSSYESVPVEQFGAALLRGMGWTGPDIDPTSSSSSSDPFRPRERLLGLGATPRPPEAKGGKSSSSSSRGAEKEAIWVGKSEKRVASQSLGPGALVWIRAPRLAGVRAVVLGRGVGLDRLSLELEGSGRREELGRSEVVLLNEEELKGKPFIYSSEKEGERETKREGKKEKEKERRGGKEREREGESEEEREKEREKERKKGKEGERRMKDDRRERDKVRERDRERGRGGWREEAESKVEWGEGEGDGDRRRERTEERRRDEEEEHREKAKKRERKESRERGLRKEERDGGKEKEREKERERERERERDREKEKERRKTSRERESRRGRSRERERSRSRERERSRSRERERERGGRREG